MYRREELSVVYLKSKHMGLHTDKTRCENLKLVKEETPNEKIYCFNFRYIIIDNIIYMDDII